MEDFLVRDLPRPADKEGHSGAVNLKYFLCPCKFCCAHKNLFQTYEKIKNLSLLKCILLPKP